MDKEQIIIDGVDIFSEIDEWADTISQEWNCDEYSTAKIIKSYILDINKQLARMNAQYNAVVEQNKNLQTELKGKEKELNEIEKIIEPYQEPIERDALSLPNAIESILERKTQECKELKKDIQIMDEEDLSVQISEERYRKYRRCELALVEIKEIAYRLRKKRDYHSPDEVNDDIDSILQKCEVIISESKET